MCDKSCKTPLLENQMNFALKHDAIISEQIKETTILKLTSLLKYHLVNEFEQNGYDFKEKKFNKLRSKKAKLILETISRIHQDKEIDKEKLKKLFDMYETYHTQNGRLWKI